MKIVINDDYGGFSVSKKALEWLADKGMDEAKRELNRQRQVSIDCYYIFDREERANPLLVECVETLGKESNGQLASLKVVEIPDDVEWQIEEYDGYEWIAEVHRKWY